MNNLLYGIQTEKFMKDDNFRVFFDDCLLFLRELINFTPDLSRLIFKLCDKMEVSYDLANGFMNFPLIDKLIYQSGLRFSEKIVQVTGKSF